MSKDRIGTHTPSPRQIAVSAPPLRDLHHLRVLEDAEWLRESLTTFAMNVASYVPGHLPAYARIFHPFQFHSTSSTSAPTWRELVALTESELKGPEYAADFAITAVPQANAPVGTLPQPCIEALLEHLHPATTTPDQCYFAVWSGFGSSVLPSTLEPKLDLPHRAYHLFAGPLAAALTSFAERATDHQSANLWWPADHRWCVATEIDFAWTYVGGPTSCIEALLADPRLEATQTSASARW